MPNIPLELPPGIVKTDSPNAAKGRYTDCNWVIFNNRKPEKRKGWEGLINDVLLGKARGSLSWTNSGGTRNIAIGTNLKLYVIQGGDSLENITPLAASGTLTDPFTTTLSSSIVNVEDTGHGRSQGDYVRFTGADAVGGITIDGEYTVTSIVDNDNYTITHTSSASSGATGGGSVDFEYEISVGLENTVYGLGWGAGGWGVGTWGTPRSSGIPLGLRFWSLSEYGNDLLALPRDGTLYLWQESSDNQAEAVSGAPASARSMFVTGERFPFLLGTTTPMTVQWPDRDDITDWTPSSTNTANSRKLQSGSYLVAGTTFSSLDNLIWSDTTLYLFRYTGSSFIYDDRVAGTNCGLLSSNAFTVGNETAFWMSGHSLHMYSGSVSDIPNVLDIRDYVFGRLNKEEVDKIWAVYDKKNNEVMWGYPSTNAEEPDSYVAVNLTDFSWTIGNLTRTTATPYQTNNNTIVMVDDLGSVYIHGQDDVLDGDGSSINSYITYGLYTLVRGERNTDIVGFVPDFLRRTGDLSIELYTKDRPDSSSNLDSHTLILSENEDIEDPRLSGRHFGFTVRSNEIGGDFRLGDVILEVQDAGGRR